MGRIVGGGDGEAVSSGSIGFGVTGLRVGYCDCGCLVGLCVGFSVAGAYEG